MNGNPHKELELIDPKKELEQMRIQIKNNEHSLQMMKAMEKRLMEMCRGS